MSKFQRCWLVFDEDGYLVCTCQHRKPENCILYVKDDK